jgi:hypothetical protein
MPCRERGKILQRLSMLIGVNKRKADRQNEEGENVGNCGVAYFLSGARLEVWIDDLSFIER